MRGQTHEYLKKFLENKAPKRVLDVGSMDVSGNIKSLFNGVEYVGVDMRSGQNVDIICNGHNLVRKFGKESFDLVVCVDTFEHDDAFWLTLDQIKKVLKKDGWMFLGVPSRRCPEHDHPHDYWRFMPQSMDLFFEEFKNYEKIVDREPATIEFEDEVYGWGQK